VAREVIVKDIINDRDLNSNKNKKSRRHKTRKRFKKRKKNNKLSLTDIENLMRQDSYVRGHGGALKQKTWRNF
jgi:hypothetical protein